jgi:hypothetical protein
VSDDELARAQTAVAWACAENFARRGEKARARELMYHNWRGAPSAAAAAKMLLRLLAPRALVEGRRLRRQRDAARRLPSLEELTRAASEFEPR